MTGSSSVDGSTTAIGAGWSVVVTQNTARGSYFCGQLHGPVALASAHQHWLGADTVDNIAAEFTAYIVAQILAFSGQFPGRIAVRPDLQLSRTIAEQEQVTTSNPGLALLARTISSWTSATTSVIEVQRPSRSCLE